MEKQTIKTKAEYEKALERFERIFQAIPGTSDSDEADLLAVLLKDYEDKHYVIDAPDK